MRRYVATADDDWKLLMEAIDTDHDGSITTDSPGLGAGVRGEGGFQMSYGQRPKPREIAQFLILDNRMPRSLTFCANKIVSNLQYLQTDNLQAPPSSAMANRLLLSEKNIDQIFDEGLHEYIQNFLLQNAELARQVEVDYRFYR